MELIKLGTSYHTFIMLIREILESIDRQVAEAQNIQRLAEIQRNLDTSALEKINDSSVAEYKVSCSFPISRNH